MNEHTLRILEFHRIIEEIKSYAWSEDGRRRIQSEGFFTVREELEEFRNLVNEFHTLYEREQEFPTLSFPDIEVIMRVAEKPGAQLEGIEIAQVIQYLRASRMLKTLLSKQAGFLKSEGEDLPDLEDLIKYIARYLDPDGNLKEPEIPSLRSIGERIRILRKEIEKLTYQYLQNPTYRGYWQTDTPALKDGRIVLPLNVNFRGKIRGVVHELSARGATLFIEPLEIFEKNNQLVDEENEYQLEVGRILRELTRKINERSLEIQFLRDRIAFLDSRQARAWYGKVHHCQFASISRDQLFLHKARHPLLRGEVVPIDIEFPSGRILILSGPNTGGKTVALKTLGLLVLMNQFGMEIPALDSILPLFDDVFADIGDEQSLTESLSTFSAHIRNLTEIYRSCTERSLLLLDELGAGTDPEEGAILAMAFLERFQEKGVYLFGSTHLGGVKQFVFSHPGMMNASVEFDVKELKPTYRIVMGVPGPSYALEIAERCGAPSSVLELARSMLQKGTFESQRLLEELFRQTQEYQARLQRVKNLQEELKLREQDLEKRERELKLREIELRQQGIRELQVFLRESRKELEALIRALREGELEKEKIRKVQEFIQQVQSTISHQQKVQEEDEERFIRVSPSIKLSPGMEVRIRNHRQKGILVKQLKDNLWEVSIGPLRMRIPEWEISEVLATPKTSQVSIDESVSIDSPRLELDVRGMRVEEALKTIEKQMDGAVLRGLKEFSIIHGKGEGILQRSIHDYLSRCPWVEDFSFALPEAGGTGKTIVRMKLG
ncbi:MAG: endonuclease MutS2 [Spirochaetes bacterium]|nr:endonuclease MutS2 [Spirochaetota bacterium]